MSHASHRVSPPMRAHRPSPRGRHRIADRPRNGVYYLRTAVAMVALLMTGGLARPHTPRRVAAHRRRRRLLA